MFWTIVNYEVWDISRPMARQVIPAPTGQVLLPDVPNWSWHEYGMRVGCWRFYELFKRLGIKPTLAANARICEDYPRVAEEAKKDGWEFMGHAYDQLPIHKNEDQAAMINRSMEVIEKFTGTRPVGWLGPGLTQTLDTPELLAKAGVQYIGDWVYDDEPTVIKTTEGPLVTLPYTVELNDIPMMIVQHHESDYLLKRAIDQFDRLYAEGKDRAKIMSLAIHPYISGQPHRIKYLEAIYDHVRRFDGVLHWNGAQILDWYKSVANVDSRTCRTTPSASCPGLTRASILFARSWIAGSSPAMTNERSQPIKSKQVMPRNLSSSARPNSRPSSLRSSQPSACRRSTPANGPRCWSGPTCAAPTRTASSASRATSTWSRRSRSTPRRISGSSASPARPRWCSKPTARRQPSR